jgi:hypothetical protein
MPKRQIFKKVDATGVIEDLGFTVTQEEIDNWNSNTAVDMGAYVKYDVMDEPTDVIDPTNNYYTKLETENLLKSSIEASVSKFLTQEDIQTLIDNSINAQITTLLNTEV